MQRETEVLVIGAGAAGLMCAATAAAGGAQVLVLDHANKPGKKILISGGGRCNFTNMDVEPSHYLCANPHFVKSALARYTQWDFIALVSRYGIAYHEREHGRLFCDRSAKLVVNMLLSECEAGGVKMELNTEIKEVEADSDGFRVHTGLDLIRCRHLVVATGGLSFPHLGASSLGYHLAKTFGHRVLPTRPGLVPLTVKGLEGFDFESLSGISLPVRISNVQGPGFAEDCLFTHRGLSGPAVLQTSNYWQPGETVEVDLLPGSRVGDLLAQTREQSPNLSLRNALAQHLPRRLVDALLHSHLDPGLPLSQLSRSQSSQLDALVHHWTLSPSGSEGFRKAEVTLGGVDTDEVSSKTLMSKRVDNLYFVGEVLDVTGWLGGYNFQWAWASGHCCGEAIAASIKE